MATLSLFGDDSAPPSHAADELQMVILFSLVYLYNISGIVAAFVPLPLGSAVFIVTKTSTINNCVGLFCDHP